MDSIGEGFPEWTELGQDSGLDPLGMQRPIEVIYQSLVPGISTITLRYRYYSFFPLILKHYEDHIRHPDPDRFRSFQRRCEALFALICCSGEAELGITGSDWASKKLQEIDTVAAPDALLDFSVGADPDADVSLRYLRNKGGAFGAIYSTQMAEMGLVHFPEDDQLNPNPVCSDKALQLAAALTFELGDKAAEFFRAVEAGQVSGRTLASLAPLKPTALKPGSKEHSLLRDVLLGKGERPTASDIMRRKTLTMLLALTDLRGAAPRTEDAKWHWFGAGTGNDASSEGEVPQLWFLFQACDLIRLAYETILSAALTLLETSARRRLSLGDLTEALLDCLDVPDGESWEDYALTAIGQGEAQGVRDRAATMLDALAQGEVDEQVRAAVALVASLEAIMANHEALLASTLSKTDYFQSLRTEMHFLQRHRSSGARELLGGMVRERILKRHLWVASRKFRNQKAYTFLMEPEEGLLRYRDHFKVSPSSPRLDQALRFLRDMSLINENGITDIGRAELLAA